MKQAERDHKNNEELSKQSGSEKPVSWRKYIEETEAAEKQAEREAQRERAAQIKKAKHSAAALKEKAKAVFTPRKGAEPDREPVKEKVQRLAESASAAARESWEQLREFAAEKRAQAGEAKAAAAERRVQAGEAKEVVAEKQAKAGEGKEVAAGNCAQDKKAEGLAVIVNEPDQGVFAKVRSMVERHPISPLLYLTVLAVAAGAFLFRNSYTRAYAVTLNGQDIGVVSSEEEFQAIVSNVESRATDILGESYNYDVEVSAVPVFATPDDFADTAQMEEQLFEEVGALIQAYSLRVDGVEIGQARSEADLYNLLDEAAQPYLSQDTIKYEFVEDVEVTPIELPANTKFDLEPIRETLSQLRVEESVYVVKKGDTFNAIAYSLDMWPYELSVLNPDVIVDKLWVDQELVIREAVPFLSVQNITDETYEETVASPVEYIETPDLYVGDTKVKEQGEDGLARVNAHVTYVNGVEVEREIISTETLKEPTTTYTYTGTTPRPVTASNGYFIWPVRGTITSNFGGRSLWGRYDFHLGIDIACPTGTSIKAADGGTVITAGWSGSYGNLVAIRHDNGYVTYYAHNSSLLVSVGQKVYQGQVIARAGMTGNASGPHCHFEVRINGTSVNPRNYL